MGSKVFYYKGVRVNIFGIPISDYNKTRIKKVKRKRRFYYINFHSELKKSAPRDLIIMYDISEEKKKERDWFRRQLKNFDYVMIQRSVWVGPSPLPKDFMDYVKLVGLKQQLKTFKLARPYIDKKDIQ